MVEVIDIAGPASVFSKAEQSHPGTYRLHIAPPAGGKIATNEGEETRIHFTRSLEAH
jgi:hypothetical protein